MCVVQYITCAQLSSFQVRGAKWRRKKTAHSMPWKKCSFSSKRNNLVYLKLKKQQIWQECNSFPLRIVEALFLYDMIYKACTAVHIIDSVYDLVVTSVLKQQLRFHHIAAGGHCSNAATCNNVRLTYYLACSWFYSWLKPWMVNQKWRHQPHDIAHAMHGKRAVNAFRLRIYYLCVAGM